MPLLRVHRRPAPGRAAARAWSSGATRRNGSQQRLAHRRRRGGRRPPTSACSCVVNDDLDRGRRRAWRPSIAGRRARDVRRLRCGGVPAATISCPLHERTDATWPLRHDTMMNPPIEGLLDRADSKFTPRHARLEAGPPDQLVLQPAVARAWAPSCRRRSPRRPASRCRSPSRRSRPTRSSASGPIRTADDEAGASVGEDGESACSADSVGTPCSTGKRVVLGVSGGIAAYKAIEVCRRLVDAGAHVIPVLTEGALHFVGAHHVRRARLRAGLDVAVGRAAPDPAHAPRPDAPTSSLVAPATARVLGLYAAGISDDLLTEHAARHPGPGARVPGDAHRDVGAPGGAGQPPRCCAPAACTSSSPRSAAWPAATSAPAAWPSPAAIVEAATAIAPGHARADDLAGLRVHRHRRRHPRADRPGALHRQPLVGQAGPRHRRGGRRPRRQGHARHHRRAARCPPASTSSASTRPPRWSTPCSAGPTRPTSSSWPPPWPTSARRPSRRQQAQEGRRRPRGRPRADHRHPRRARRPPARPARCWSASPPRPTTCGPTPAEKLSRKGIDLIVANDVSAPGVGFEHDTNAVVDPRRADGSRRPRSR